MRKLLGFCVLAVLVLGPVLAGAQSSMMNGSRTGSHGFDWMIGSWTCKNSIPSALGGPAVQMLTASRSSTTGAIVFRYSGTSYDQYGFYSYVGKTNTWWSSWAYPGGSIGNESTKQTGNKIHWTGVIFDASTGKHLHIRDTYTVYGPTKFNDLGEDDSTGAMKPGYNGTCVKS
ncbi:MAG TPA: hypothetical protein VFE17_08885 [Candidatus Baltobacteraceae bacterium]|nr:hypothetical protein [Candidatus Baltobacteraceae bacterium]